MRGSQGGYIALLAILIVGAVSIAVASTLLVSGTDNQRIVLVHQQTTQARNAASACAEDALQYIRDNIAYVGSASVGVGAGTCTHTVTDLGSGQRQIDASAQVGTSVQRLQVHATINASNISIISWQETS